VTEDVLARLADEIDAHAMISTRPGQLADLERIASELRQFNARLAEHRRSWSMIVDDYSTQPRVLADGARVKLLGRPAG
jgi:hypothetical protein